MEQYIKNILNLRLPFVNEGVLLDMDKPDECVVVMLSNIDSDTIDTINNTGVSFVSMSENCYVNSRNEFVNETWLTFSIV